MIRTVLVTFILLSTNINSSDDDQTIKDIFSSNNTNQIIMDIEAALARAQSSQGIIPEWAAKEITAKANIKYMPQNEVDEENKLVRHRLVSRLNIWKKSLDLGAEEYLHFGATTVDIFDTVLVLQVKKSINIFLDDLLEIEASLLSLTKDNIDTYMVGRTIGQHALPMTFGKKTSTWFSFA